MFKKLSFVFVGLFILAILPFVGCVEASSEFWSKTFGGDDMDACRAMVQTSDGGFAMLGFAHSFSTGSFLIKTNADGNLEWNKTIGGYGQGAYSFIQTLDGGFAFVGTHHNASAVSGYIPVGRMPEGYWAFIWLAKADEYGNLEWNQTYDGMSGYYDGYSLVQTSDEGYALAGTFSNDTEHDNLLLIKTDSYGNLEWSKSYDGSQQETEPKLVQTSDGGYALVCRTFVDTKVAPDIWLIKTDNAGNVEWNKTYGGAMGDYPTALLYLPDEGFAISGYTSSFGYGHGDFWLIKIDKTGNMIWNKTYGTENPETLSSLAQTFDGGFAIAGYTQTDNDLVSNFLLIKTDNLGNMLWNQTFTGGAVLGLPSLVQPIDGGFALSGGIGSFETGDWDFWLIKTDSKENPDFSSTLTPTPTQQTSPSPTIPEFPAWLALSLLLIGATFLAIICREKFTKRFFVK